MKRVAEKLSTKWKKCSGEVMGSVQASELGLCRAVLNESVIASTEKKEETYIWHRRCSLFISCDVINILLT